MNTAHLIPIDCIAPILIRQRDNKDFPFFAGTGFFVNFPPYLEIYFVTARHCVCENSGELKGAIEVKLNTDPKCKLAVPFLEHLAVLESEAAEDYEDVTVLTVGTLSEEAYARLFERSLRLPDQRVAEFLQLNLVVTRGKVRTIGYPGESKNIDYDANHATVQPRGIVGTVTAKSNDSKWFTVESLNWKGESIAGFSGSPIIEFVPSVDQTITPLPIGVLATGGGNSIFKFISINMVTNLISARLIKRDGITLG